jgi:multisubunit Na+/H+ antiporter MnhB subunit
MTVLAIIATIVGILAVAYYPQKYVKERYQYSVCSIGGMAVSFIGAATLAFSFNYYQHKEILYMVITLVLGVAPYIFMFIRDMRRTTIVVAIAALILRFTISALLVLIILWYVYVRRSSLDEIKARLKNIERAVA